jgi:MFS family permease
VTKGSGRFKVPEFLADLGQPPGALAVLVAGSMALFAAGLDPRVFSSGTPDAQAALRERPQVEALFLLSAIAEAAFLLIGGVLGDVIGRRRVLLTGLVAMAFFETSAMITGDGPLFYASRIGAVASVGFVLPVALAVVAVTYTGATRATALGIAYAALSAATALTPALLLAVTPTVGRWPSFVVAIVGVVIAAYAVWRSVPRAEPAGLPIRAVYPHALWAFGLLAITGGIVGFRADRDSLIRTGLIVVGVILVAAFLVLQRRRGGQSPDAAIDIRPTTVALVAGVVIAIAQTAPMLELPLFFQIAQQYAPLLATIALAPFIIALIVSGPIAGALLVRYSPRTLIAGGLVIVGSGDLLLAQASPDTTYLFFILPFFAVGAGFVVGTCVRTAVIFASTPRRLPATAAALNQTSLVVGGQAGVAGVTALVSAAAIAAFTASLPTGTDVTTAVDGFRSFMLAVGTSEFGELLNGLSSTTGAAYGAAFAAGVHSAMIYVGLAAVAAGVIAWFAMSGPSPVNSIWEHREERAPAA